MPIYEYRCEDGHTFEAIQNMSDDPVQECEQCGAPVERVFHPVAVHFKGSGFYSTDYAGKSESGTEQTKDGDSSGSSDDSKGASSGDSKSDSKDESKQKGESKAGTKAASGD